MPLRISCPGPVIRLVWSGGGVGLVPCAPLPGSRSSPRSRACASRAVRHLGSVYRGGGSVAAPPGGAAGSGSVGGSRGSGGRGSLCLALSLCLPRTSTNAGFFCVALSREGVVPILLRFVYVRSCLGAVREGRRGEPLCTGGWLAGRPVGWPAPQLAEVTVGTEWAGDSPRARGVWALWRSAPGAALLPVGRGGRGLPWPGRGGTGLRSPIQLPALCGLRGGGGGGGRARVVESLCPPSGPRFHSLAAAGAGSRAQAQAPPTVNFPSHARGRLGVPRAAQSRRAGRRWGPLLKGQCLLVPCDVPEAEGGVCAVGAPCAPFSATCPTRAVWCLQAPGAAW